MSDTMQAEHEAEQARRAQIAEAAMEEQGVSSSLPVQADYFGFTETHRVMLPDGISWIEHQTLNEGARRQYLNKVNKEVAIKRVSGDAVMKMQSGDDKHTLLEAAIVGWNIIQGGKPLTFSKGSKGSTLNQFLEAAPPKIVDIIETDVRKHNPWLMADLSVEDIDKQIEELNTMREAKLKEEAGKVS